MDKVLVIGNGFDLYHKLPTQYTDFLYFVNHWDSFISKYDSATKEIKDEDTIEVSLSEKGQLTEQSISDFAKYKDAYSVEELEQFEKNRSNKWITYFNRLLSDQSITGTRWIDFEQEIYNALKHVAVFFDMVPLAFKDNKDFYSAVSNGLSVVWDVFFNSSPISYVQEKHKYNYYDKDLWNKYKEDILEYLKQELNKLCCCLEIYLLEFVCRIKNKVYSEQIKLLGSVRLLNFNYTNTYKEVYGGERMTEQHAIHGSALEKDIVLGIPDDTFADTTDYVYFQKYFQRIQKRTGSYYKKWISEPKRRVLEDMPVEVYIIGHSLGESDKGILQDIFLNDYVKKIYIFYHSQDSYEKMVINLVKMFGKDFVIVNTVDRIEFIKLKEANSENG